MKLFSSAIAAVGVTIILLGAAHADGAIRIQSFDSSATGAAAADKRPPKCVFIWGNGFPAPGASGPGSVKIVTNANRYSQSMERLAREGGVLPLVMITDTHEGKTVTLKLKQVSVQNFQRLRAGAVSVDGGADVLQQEWSIAYEAIQR